jgi:hypothetical protein
MPTQIYETANVKLLDGTELYITPLKIKYLREFMSRFDDIAKPNKNEETIDILIDCTRIAMKQYYPIIKTADEVEDTMDIDTMYTVLEVGGGIKLKVDESKEPEIEQSPTTSKGNSWNDFDIAKLESELFLLGIWKDYEELETSLSLPELTEILNAKRDADYQEKKFLAAMQGVDLDEQSGNKKDDPWEAMKARVATKGKISDPNDIMSFQGIKAQQEGFGIGMGLEYGEL